MAIAVDATSSSSGSAGTTLTFAHTCTGTDLVLVVCVSCVDATTISGVTYNSVALTSAISNGGDQKAQCWVLVGPSTGANNIVVTKTSGAEVDAGGVSFTGAGGYDGTGTGSGFGTSDTLTITTNKPKGYGVSCLSVNDPGSITYTGSGTNWAENEAGGFGSSYSYKAYTGGADVSETWTSANSRSWRTAGVEIYEKPAAAGFFFLMGS